jgi:hypothetical protein
LKKVYDFFSKENSQEKNQKEKFCELLKQVQHDKEKIIAKKGFLISALP